jgi:two-component SAPR family response regulator
MISVVIIDDEEDALDLLEILLQDIGDVTVAGRFSDPVRAIRALETTPVDAVFLDIQMPGLKGTEAARQIKLMHPQTPIVFTTAYSEYAVEAFEIESNDYLLKPFTMERLQVSVSRIKQAISGRRTWKDSRVHPFIQCLGGFFIHLPDGNRTLTWRTNKEREICAFLIHHKGKPVDTALIIESIWPEYDLKKARTYLYTCLSYLRRSLAENNIPANVNKAGNGFAISLDELESDAAEFEAILAKILFKETIDAQLYDKMNVLYEGDYMDGCDYSWALAKQTVLREKYIRALRKFYGYFRGQGNLALAEDSLQRLMAMAPDSEKDGRELIKLYMESGNRNEARNVYRQIEQAVRIDLGIELEEETEWLYKQINFAGVKGNR